MNISSIKTFCQHSTLLIKESVFSLSTQNKRIVAIMLAVLSCLAVSYLLYRSYFKDKKRVALDALSHKEEDSLLAQAQASWKEKYLDPAAVNYKKVLEINPENFDALVGYASILRLKNQWALAANYYEKALKIEPKNAYALIGYAEVLRHQDQLDLAIGKCREALAIDPKNISAIALEVAILRQQGKLSPLPSKKTIKEEISVEDPFV